jgi:hypothetical protein
VSEEQWRPVVGFEGKYEVSDYGRVRSVDRLVHDRDGRRTREFRGKVLVPWQSSQYGHVSVSLSARPGPMKRQVHVLVAEAFLGPRPDGLLVLHGPNGVRDNSVGNLRYGTPRQNLLDTNRDGTNHHRNRTHCPRRHPLRAPNLVASVARRGHRECLACRRANANLHTARKRHGIELDLAFEADRHYARITAATPTD